MDNTIFLGDILITETTTIDLAVDASNVNFVLGAGTWFANAYEMWKYLLGVSNPSTGFDVTVTLDATGTVTMDVGFVIEFEITVDVAAVWAALGLAASYTYEASGTFTTPNVLPSFFAPAFPLVSYIKSVSSDDRYTDRSQTGVLYSLVGNYQEMREMEVALDYRVGAGADSLIEKDLWEELWESYWLIGRSVTVYLDGEDIVSGIPDGVNALSAGESLTFGSAPDKLSYKRVVEYTDDTVAVADAQKFYLRRVFPAYGDQNIAWELT